MSLLNLQMDRREPDDPSPYLLAIWTPGAPKTQLIPGYKSVLSNTEHEPIHCTTLFGYIRYTEHVNVMSAQ